MYIDGQTVASGDMDVGDSMAESMSNLHINCILSDIVHLFTYIYQSDLFRNLVTLSFK